MPVVLRMGPYSFYFFSNEQNEPPHIHIERDKDDAKFWLNPVELAANHGFRTHELNVIQKLVLENEIIYWSAGMPTSQLELDATAVDVSTDDETLRVVLADGREILTPLLWFPRLASATTEQRSAWRLVGHGIGIAWDALDEHLSIAGLLRQH